MEPATYLAAIRRESAAFAAAAGRDLTAPVPSCPGWDVAELVRHLGRVQHWVAGGVRAGSRERFARWFEAGAADLVAVLEEAGPDRAVWNFILEDGRVATTGWWFRRQAQEAAMHRWDAEAATGAPPVLEPELAADGVDEFLHIVLPHAPGIGVELVGSLHLHRTDGEGEWMVRFLPAGMEVSREHGKGDTAVRGPASGLLLWLSNRTGSDGLEVFGDRQLVERWPQLVRF